MTPLQVMPVLLRGIVYVYLLDDTMFLLISVIRSQEGRMWNSHDRLEEQVTEQSCRDEIESVRTHGQLFPVLGRALKHDMTHDFELVYGSRRLFVARHLNIPLQVEVGEISDREALIALDIENRQRKDLSPYERGRSYASWIRSGLFSSQDELARILNVSSAQVSRLLKLAQLPTVLVKAFPSPLDIRESWGRDLMGMWEDPAKRRLLTAGARDLAEELPRVSAVIAFERLIASKGGRRTSLALNSSRHDEVVKDDGGAPLFRVQVRRKDIALLLPTEALSRHSLAAIKTEVAVILQRARSQAPESPTNYSGNVPDESINGVRKSQLPTATYVRSDRHRRHSKRAAFSQDTASELAS